MDELIVKSNSEDTVANIKRLIIDFSNSLPDDKLPNGFLAVETTNYWQYLTDLDGRLRGRIVLDVTAEMLMTDEEKEEALRHLPSQVQTWEGNRWIATKPGLSGKCFNTKSIGKIEILRLSDERARILNQIEHHGDELWRYLEDRLRNYGLVIDLDDLVEINLRTAVPTTLTPPQVSALGKRISELFNEGELRDLTRKLSLDYENLSGDNKDSKAVELVDHARRHSRVPELWTKLCEERPHGRWSQVLVE